MQGFVQTLPRGGKWRELFVIIIASLLAINVAFAQTTISGKIISSEDQGPLPGVNILIKGTTNGAISDANGKYRIDANSTDVLVFSFVGFKTQEIAVEGRTVIDVTILPDALQLAEVVVTALGIEKDKSKIGYATQEVKGSSLLKAREPNPINALVGKVAGLNVGASAELIGPPAISLRGRSNVLYVVDGVPITSDTWNISPDDIETYTVLKGPAASALYGTRGVNGAIVISTKRGSLDKRGFSIDVNSSTMWDKGFLTIPKVQDEYGPGDHGRYAFADGKGGGLYDSDYDIWGPPFEGQLIPQYDGVVDPNNDYITTFPNGASFTGSIIPTPWVARGKDNLQRFLRAGVLSTNNVAVSASGEKYDLRFSYSHGYQRGILPNTDLNSDNFNVTTGFDFSDKIRLESNINYNRQYSENFPDVQYGPNSMIYNITIWGGADWDIDDMKNYWQPGKEGVQQIYADYTRYNNPWFLVKEWLRGHQKTDIYGYLTLKYKPTDYLEILGRTAVSTYQIFRSEKFPYSGTVYGREQGKGDYREDHRQLYENNSDLLITFNKDLLNKDLNVTASVGANARIFNYESSYITTDYLNVPASSLTPGAYSFDNSLNPVKAYNFRAPMAVYSAYYTADISFRKWLNVSTTGRYDNHSSLYPTETKYFFPSVSGSLVVSELVDLPGAISSLKLRSAYARVGEGFTRANIGPTPSAAYPLGYGSSYSSPYGGPTYGNQAIYDAPLVYQNQPGAYYSNTLTNNELKPYFSSATEIGLDAKFLSNKIGLDVTYFNNIDGPQISTLPLPSSTGYTGYIANGTKTQRNGWEVVVNANPLNNASGLTWNVLVNWSTFKETLKELPNGATRLGFIEIGDRMDAYYAGAFYKTQEGELINDASGRPIRTDVSQFLGNTNPDWSWGITNRFNYKNFGLSFQFDGRVGGVLIDYIQRQTFRGGRHIETTQGAMGEARYQDYLGVKSWVGPGVTLTGGAIEYDPITGKITNYDELTFAPNTTATYLQDWIGRYYAAEEANVISRSYAKLREVTLSYNIPEKLLSRTLISKASVSLVGRNLLYFAEKKDVDIDQFVAPDAYSSLQSPTLRRYGFNVNLTF